MELIEIARLYKTIKRYYPAFDASTEAVRDAERYLKDVPYEVAAGNLDKHILNERFPPSISDLRGNYHDHSSTIPDAKETREAFKALDDWKAKATPPPEHVKARLKEIALRHANRTN